MSSIFFILLDIFSDWKENSSSEDGQFQTVLYACLYRLPIWKHDPNFCFAIGDDAFDGLADKGIVIRQGAVAENGENGGQGLFSRVVLGAPLLHGLQALAEVVLFYQSFNFRDAHIVVANG